MIEAYKKMFINYANFSGRSTRSDFWYVILCNFILGFIVGFVGGLLDMDNAIDVIIVIYSLVIIIPSLALVVRRLHDINQSGFWIFISCVPLVGEIIFLIFMCTASVDDNNQYGERV